MQPKSYFINAYHHVYNRGNNKQLIFKDDLDYAIFIKRLRLYKNKFNIDILAYCLMPNHFHLLTQQKSEQPLFRMIQFLTNGYAMYFNKRHQRVGHLFQGKFQAKNIAKEKYLVRLSQYIHLNPANLGLSPKNIYKYPWSSLPDYLQIRNGTLPDKNLVLSYFNNQPQEYQQFMRLGIDKNTIKRILPYLFAEK